MARPAIEVRQLGKRYRIGIQAEPYGTLRGAISSALRPASRSSSKYPELWALRDLDLTVEEGEVVGIIGRNGAGKTTLLKILTHIAQPTTGVARHRGRVGALIEVGTGFHPELTGSENIYLNGAILGMRKKEIDRKFDEIVAFSEIERFIDTPIKRYSSGMQTRLAFSVAAHIEPDILLVDEVLAVGDAAFQRKSLGKMGEVARAGRTVLFVSHNTTAIVSLCSRVIWLDGTLIEDGEPDQVVNSYLSDSSHQQTEQEWSDPSRAPGDHRVRLRRASIAPLGARRGARISVRTPLLLSFEYWNLVEGADLVLSVHLRNEQDVTVFNTGPVGGHPLAKGLFRSSCVIPGDLMNDGRHAVHLQVVKDEGSVIYEHQDILVFDVSDSREGRGAWYGKWPGAVRPMLEWNTEQIGPH
jgi:lipopolysaccharide transport system ATP-binding protein